MKDGTPSYKKRVQLAIRDVREIDFLNDGKRALKRVDQYLANSFPKDPDLLTLKGNILDILGRYKTSEAAYREVLKRNPLNVSVRIDLGDCLFNQKAYAKALVAYNRAIKDLKHSNTKSAIWTYTKEDEIIEAYKGKGECLLMLNRTKAALSSLVQALQLYPWCMGLTHELQKVQEIFSKQKPN